MSKNIKVVDAVLKQVVIKSLDWNSGWGRPTTWPTFTKANVWVEIVKGAPNKDYPTLAKGSFEAPIIYKSRIASNIDSSSVPILFDIPNIVLNIPTLENKYGYNGIGYGLNLYVQDATGTYLGSSSF